MSCSQCERWPTGIEVAFMAFSFASFGTVGLSLILTSWVATVEGSMLLLGQLFFASSLLSLVFSLYAGVLIDRKNRLALVRWGQGLRLAAVACLAVGFVMGSSLSQWLFAYIIFFTIGSLLSAGALEGIIQIAVPKKELVRLALRISVCRQIGILCGTGLGGVLCQALPPIWTVGIMSLLMLMQLAIINRFFNAYSNEVVRNADGYLSAWKEGMHTIAVDRGLLLTIATIALLFSISQMTNVLVPGFVRNTLQRGSDVYGLLEMSWAIGGGVVLMTAAFQYKLFRSSLSEKASLIIIGLVMVIFASLRSVPVLVVTYALLGALFAFGRALADSRILTQARNEDIGRVRAATTMTTSFLGMAIYISPTLLGSENTIAYYIGWGFFISAAGLVVFALDGRPQRQPRSRDHSD